MVPRMGRATPPTTAEGDRALPRRFGDYVLVEHLAQGGRGDVFVAVQPSAPAGRNTCVIKRLRADLTADQEYVNRFLAEARTAVQLQHPHIASVVDVGRVDGAYYLALEHVPGRTLREIVERANADRGGLPLGVSLALLGDLLDALDYAHHRNSPNTGKPLRFVHREVSPMSVMVSYEGDLKLTDVGLARSTLELERTLPGDTPGRLAYQPPEQVRGDELDARTDVFAVAVLAYELASGERFYGKRSTDAVWQLALAGGFLPSGFAKLPGGLRTALERALRADVHRRTPSCTQLRRELSAFQEEAKVRPGSVRALMTMLYPGAAAASRRHLESLARARAAALPAGGKTVRFVEAPPLASAEAPTVVRDVSALRDELSSEPGEVGVPPTAPSRPRFDLPTTDADPRSHEAMRPLALTEADVATEPDVSPPSLAARRAMSKARPPPDVTVRTRKPPTE